MSAIKKGDLVMVVRWPCCGGLIGLPAKVSKFLSVSGHTQGCAFCNAPIHQSSDIAFFEAGKSAPLAWLIKIDPPALPESTTTERELVHER